MLRLILVALFLVIYFIFSIPFWGVTWIIGRFNKDAKDRINYSCVQWAFGIVYRLSGVKPVIQGLENIPKDTAVLYIGNHQSIFDVVMTYHLAPGITGFMAKDNIRKIPFLSRWMKLTYCLFLTRTDPRIDLKEIVKAIDYVKAGKSIFIFPEGTRTKTGEMNAFHEGSFKIATKSNCPIVPVAITGTRDIFENHMPFLKSSKVVISYGKPIILSELDAEQKKHLGVYCQGIIEEALKENEALMK
ncbi:MAG: 1-acyl-sn-glycerol-3-phosphate acyltransferase [Pseudobutyrivibrio sp.]|nr:1-acyl-sn-glycerol-3-phosphate acyltransferase [Pseudobutyrivibrio sp.]